MTRPIAYILIAVGMAFDIYCLSFFASGVPLRELWFVIGLFLILGGFYILAKLKIQTLTTHEQASDSLLYLREMGLRVEITLDNCEVKSRFYTQEAAKDHFPTRSEMLDGLIDSERKYKADAIQQAYIVMEKEFNGTLYKYISRPSSLDPTTVRMQLDKLGGVLYIDREDPTRYLFELPF